MQYSRTYTYIQYTVYQVREKAHSIPFLHVTQVVVNARFPFLVPMHQGRIGCTKGRIPFLRLRNEERLKKEGTAFFAFSLSLSLSPIVRKGDQKDLSSFQCRSAFSWQRSFTLVLYIHQVSRILPKDPSGQSCSNYVYYSSSSTIPIFVGQASAQEEPSQSSCCEVILSQHTKVPLPPLSKVCLLTLPSLYTTTSTRMWGNEMGIYEKPDIKAADRLLFAEQKILLPKGLLGLQCCRLDSPRVG